MTATARSSNEIKYATGNPVVRRMIAGFFTALGDIVEQLEPTSVLDAGCGEGEAIERLAGVLPEHVVAVDVEQRCVDHVHARHPFVEVSRHSLLERGFPDRSFELVLCLEVLEHLLDPAAAVEELSRVSARDLVVSVPYEPYFRLGSMLLGKHVRRLGSHPEHVGHFNRASLAELLEPAVDLVELRVAFPWLIAHGRTRG